MTSIRFTVPGPLVTQGSMAVVRGRVVHSKRKRKDGSRALTVAQWRKLARGYAGIAMRGQKLLDEPVCVHAQFYVERPKRSRWREPGTGLDLDKLQRALGDALEGVVVANDSRICEWQAVKLYAHDAHQVGVDVEVSTIGGGTEWQQNERSERRRVKPPQPPMPV